MYNKLFTKILDSSIWLEDNATRIVWVTCIAAMDEHGFCSFAAPANVARRAGVTLKEATAALLKFEGPDADSSDQDNEGRRLERVPGGWLVLNAHKYRDMVTRAVIQEQTRERVRKHRARKNSNADSNAPVTPSDTDTNTDQKQEREDTPAMPADTFFSLYATLYKERYGFAPSLIVNQLDFGKLGLHRKSMTDVQIGSALAGFFESDNPYVLKRRHPLGLFLANPMEYLPLPKKGGICEHDPTCASFAVHTSRVLEDGRTARDNQQKAEA